MFAKFAAESLSFELDCFFLRFELEARVTSFFLAELALDGNLVKRSGAFLVVCA